VYVDHVSSRIANGEKYYSRPLVEDPRFVVIVDFGTDNVVRVGVKAICREPIKVQFGNVYGYPLTNRDGDEDNDNPNWIDSPAFVDLTPVDGVTLTDYPFMAGFDDNDEDFTDTLAIFLDIRYIIDGDSERPTKSKFANDHVRLSDDAPFSDLTIIVGEGVRHRSFRTHKCVLYVRSEYFRGLFDSGMEESSQDQLRYENVDPEAFLHFRKFLYTNEFPQDLPFDEMKNLWVVANQFIAPDLEECLEELFVKRLSSRDPIGNVLRGNLLESLSFAHEFSLSLPLLLESCLLYARGSLRLLRTTEQWKEMERDQPDLVALVLVSDPPSSSSSSSPFLTPPTSPSPPSE